MSAVRLPAFMALAALLTAAGVSCCPPVSAPVVQPCPPIQLPVRPHLPIKDYKPEWTKDQLLGAYAQTTALLFGWMQAAEALIVAHNAPTVKKPPSSP